MRPLFDPERNAVMRMAERALSRTQLMRRRAYRRAFLDGAGALKTDMIPVLADLRRFCSATASTFDPDPRIHALREGRREAFWRIIGFLNIDEADLLTLVERDVMETDDHE